MAGFAVTQGSAINSSPEMEVGAEPPAPFWDSVKRGGDLFWNVQRGGARHEQVRAELWRRNTQIQQATGKALSPSDLMNSQPGVLAGLLGSPMAAIERAVGTQMTDADYEAEVERLRGENPKALAGIETRDAMMARLQARWGKKAKAADDASQTVGGATGVFLGSAGASMGEPENIVGTVLTGGWGAGRPLLTRMLAQAGANAGIEATLVPERMTDAARFGGPKYGAGEAALDVAAAGGGGAGLEALGAGLKAGFKRLTQQSVGDTQQALRRAEQLAERLDLDDAAVGPRDGAAHAEAVASLDAMAPPPRFEPDRDLADLFTGGAATTDYKGRPIHAGRFDPADVAADPVRFQYKADGDEAGVTARLRGIEAWDPTASGKVLVWKDRGGALFIADGHQRRGLALRMVEKGWDAELDGYLFREAEGWRAQEVRTVAALKNIREGQGSPIDAAKVFRDAPDAMADRSLPVTGDFMAKARGLAQLSPEAFGAAVNKVIPEAYAADVGAMAAHRPDLHMGMVALLREADPANGDEARALIVEALQDDWIKTDGDQVDLFGYDPSTSAMIGRAKVAAAVKRALARDARLFSQLVKHADAIETGGNALARDANEARLALDRAALEITAKLSLRAGPIGEAMAQAAQKVANGEAPATAAKDVLARVRAALEAGESFEAARVAEISPQPPSAASRALLADFDEPAGKGADAQGKPAPEDAELEGEDAPPGLFDDLPQVGAYDKAHKALVACAPGT